MTDTGRAIAKGDAFAEELKLKRSAIRLRTAALNYALHSKDEPRDSRDSGWPYWRRLANAARVYAQRRAAFRAVPGLRGES